MTPNLTRRQLLAAAGGTVGVGPTGACTEEVGLDPDTIHVIGLLPPMALPDSGFLVHPVLAWSQAPVFNRSMNYAEVASVIDTPLRQLAGRAGGPHQPPAQGDIGPAVDLRRLGKTTGAVVDLLLAVLHRAGVDLDAVEVAKATVHRGARGPAPSVPVADDPASAEPAAIGTGPGGGGDPTIGPLGVRPGHG